MDEAEFGVDDISEEEYNRLKEENMAQEKRDRPKKPSKSYKNKRGPKYNPEGKLIGLRKGGKV
jgi:hypothetical protein